MMLMMMMVAITRIVPLLTELALIQSLSEVGISPTDNVCIVAWHSTIVVML